jgi:hypothetical protein
MKCGHGAQFKNKSGRRCFVPTQNQMHTDIWGVWGRGGEGGGCPPLLNTPPRFEPEPRLFPTHQSGVGGFGVRSDRAARRPSASSSLCCAVLCCAVLCCVVLLCVVNVFGSYT